jgi:hypothetical protein
MVVEWTHLPEFHMIVGSDMCLSWGGVVFAVIFEKIYFKKIINYSFFRIF